jgi:hypothetical protein
LKKGGESAVISDSVRLVYNEPEYIPDALIVTSQDESVLVKQYNKIFEGYFLAEEK